MSQVNTLDPMTYLASIGYSPAFEPLLRPVEQKDGTYAAGKLHFDTKDDADIFTQGQRFVWDHTSQADHATQIQTLQMAETQGIGAFEKPLPHTTKSLDALLTPSGPTDANGYDHFGNLEVSHKDVDAFRQAQQGLAATNPESVDTLAKLETMPTTRLNTNVPRGDDRFQPALGNEPRTISWSPHLMLSDGKTAESPMQGLLHEETHANEDRVANLTLKFIPSSQYQNAEEQRVIEGAEKREVLSAGGTPRADHGGFAMDTVGVASTAPALLVRNDDGSLRNAVTSGTVEGTLAGTQDLPRVDVKGGGHFDLNSDELGAIANHSGISWDDLRGKDAVSFTVGANGISMTDPATQPRKVAREAEDHSALSPDAYLRALERANPPY